MVEVNEAFLRTLKARLEECSTYAQISEYFLKHGSILYNKQAFELFSKRLIVIKEASTDSETRKMCESLMEDFQDAHSITVVSNSKGKLPVSFHFKSNEGRVLRDTITELIRTVLLQVKGKQKEVCRILGVTAEEFDALLDADKERRRVYNDTKKTFRNIKE